MSGAMRVGLTVAGIAGFVALLVLGGRMGSAVECSGCIEFGAGRECRTGRGADRETALESVRTSACAMLASGVTESFACSVTPAVDVVCKGD